MLNREYLMLEIERLAVAPVFGRELGQRVPCVIAGIVDEHPDGSQLRVDLTKMRLIRSGVADVTEAELRSVFASRGETRDQCVAGSNVDIAKRHARALLCKVLH